MNNKTILILDNIRSTHNVGSIFRTADAAGVTKIFLIGTTPDPLDRFGRVQKDISKTALGAEKNIPWEHATDTIDLLSKFPNHFKIALEQSENSVDYKTVLAKEQNIIILGPEVTGLPENILDACDVVAEISMNGMKESLNVSVATGIFLFRFLNI
jgi:23S rRNA (guanosine2251-2'-O)-methyltransferase